MGEFSPKRLVASVQDLVRNVQNTCFVWPVGFDFKRRANRNNFNFLPKRSVAQQMQRSKCNTSITTHTNVAKAAQQMRNSKCYTADATQQMEHSKRSAASTTHTDATQQMQLRNVGSLGCSTIPRSKHMPHKCNTANAAQHVQHNKCNTQTPTQMQHSKCTYETRAALHVRQFCESVACPSILQCQT